MTHSQSTLDSASASSLPEDQGHVRPPMDLSTSTMGTVAASAMSPPAMNFSQRLDIDLHSLLPLSDTSLIPSHSRDWFQLPPHHVAPGAGHGVQQSNMEHIQALLASNRTLQQTVDEKTREVEHQRASVADHKATTSSSCWSSSNSSARCPCNSRNRSRRRPQLPDSRLC